MLRAELVSPANLTAGDIGQWRALQAQRPEFRSPLMGPDFALLVGEIRADAAVLIIRRGAEAVGFLPHHRRPWGLGRPIGAPFSDLHGPIIAAGLDLDEEGLLRLARLRAFSYSGLIDPFGVFQASVENRRPSHFVEGPGAFERIRDRHPIHYKKNLRRERRLGELAGPLSVVLEDRNRAALAAAFAWKRAQLRRSGRHDFLRPAWTRELMQRVFASKAAHLATLYAGGRPIAARFGVAAGEVVHPWITAYDPQMARFSPGNILLWKFLEGMPHLGFSIFDLGPGHDHDKSLYATGALVTASGTARLRPARARLTTSMARRLNHIAEVELGDVGRLLGVATALAGRARRARSLRTEESALP